MDEQLSYRIEEEELIEPEHFASEPDDELERILQQPIPVAFPEKLKPPKTEIKLEKIEKEYDLKEATEQKRTKRTSFELSVPRISSIESLIKRTKPIKYFIMKCTTHKNLKIALEKNIWATQDHNEKKLNDAYRDNEVILIFSVNLSQGFQGYARMASRIGTKASSVWEHHVEFLGGLFHLEWVCNKEVSFRATERLYNPYNEDKPVKISRDGQEIHRNIGYQLCTILDGGSPYDPEKATQRMPQSINRPPGARPLRFVPMDLPRQPSLPPPPKYLVRPRDREDLRTTDPRGDLKRRKSHDNFSDWNIKHYGNYLSPSRKSPPDLRRDLEPRYSSSWERDRGSHRILPRDRDRDLRDRRRPSDYRPYR